MAENETLDIKASPPWNAVIRAIRDGKPTVEVQGEIKLALARCWAAIRNTFRKCGFSLKRIAIAAGEADAAFLGNAYRISRYHKFIRLLQNCAAYLDNPSDVVTRGVDAQLRIVRQQIRDLFLSQGICSTVAEADARVAAPFENVLPDARAFARTLIPSPKGAQAALVGEHSSDLELPSMLSLSLVHPAAPPVGVSR